MKIGVAHAAGLYNYPDDGAQFANGCDAIWNLGVRTVKLYCTREYTTDYPEQSIWSAAPTSCIELLQSTEFATQLERAWDTVILTMFAFANPANNWWRVGVTNASLQAEYDEIKAAVTHLLSTYSDRNFIIQNWESDWAFMDAFDPDTHIPRQMVDYYRAFLGARQAAIADARRNTASTAKVQHAVEVNRVLDSIPSFRRRVINDVFERVLPDVISYSAYEGTIVSQGGWGATHTAWEAATEPVLRRALRIIKRWGRPFYIGEFGYPENEAADQSEPRDVGAMVRFTAQIAADEGATHLVYWQVFDNETHPEYTYRGFWTTKPDGSTSDAGLALASLI